LHTQESGEMQEKIKQTLTRMDREEGRTEGFSAQSKQRNLNSKFTGYI